MCLGKLALNICGEELSQMVHKINSLISSLVPLTSKFDLTIDNLNKTKLCPKKNHSENRLNAGILQLPNNTHFVINEFTLQEGNLDSNGVKNCTSLSTLVTSQTVEYDFEFFQLSFPCDLPVVTLSRAKSFLPADLVVPFCPSTKEFSTPKLSPSLISKYRTYVALLRNEIKNQTFSKPNSNDHLNKLIEDTFLKARQENSSLPPETLHLWLTLAKIISSSLLEVNLSEETWNHVMTLEETRRFRVSQTPKIK